MRRTLLPLSLALLMVAGCGGDDDSGDNSNLPPEAQALIDNLGSGTGRMMTALLPIVGHLPFLANPGVLGGLEGVTFEPDFSAGAPPHSYVFSIPVDVDDDGSTDGVLTGSCTLSDDPANAGEGFTGTVDIGITAPLGLASGTASLAFELVAGGADMSGSATIDDPMVNATFNVFVAAEDPIRVLNAAGNPAPTANACALSLDGAADLSIIGGEGTLASTWSFSSNRRTARVTDAVFVDGEGEDTELPDSDQEITCGGGSIQDWVGVFDQTYTCIPSESGEARLTVTVTGPSTIHIVDEDPPGSGDFASYEASILPGNPRSVRGSFIGGPAGFHYREDFTWTLSPDKQSFSEMAIYIYREGALSGTGGLCGARGVRE